MPKILQLKISLNEINPKIWRRFLVYDNIRFEELHNIIQEIMGWENYHLYEFSFNSQIRIGPMDEDADDDQLEDSNKTKLKKYIIGEKQKIYYLYDFGDSWEHEIIVEKIFEYDRVQKIPFCLEGERACPPEDCGAVSGYENLTKIKNNKEHPDYNDLIVNWLGEDFDFEEFDLNDINKRLKKYGISKQ